MPKNFSIVNFLINPRTKYFFNLKAMEQIFSIFQEIDFVIKQLKLNGKIPNTEENEEIKEELWLEVK